MVNKCISLNCSFSIFNVWLVSLWCLWCAMGINLVDSNMFVKVFGRMSCMHVYMNLSMLSVYMS